MTFLMICLTTLPLLATRVRAVTDFAEWYEPWRNTALDYTQTLGGPQNISTSTVINDTLGYGYQLKVSLGISVYQYMPSYTDFGVYFRTFICIESYAPPNSIPCVFAERAELDIDKDTGSSNMNLNSLYFSNVQDDPRYFQGNNLTKGEDMPLTVMQALGHGWAVATTAVAAFLPPAGGIASMVAADLLDTGYGSQPADYQNMAWTDAHAASYWYNPHSYNPLTQIFRQSCLDTECWYQYENQEPATYNGILLRALITLTNPGGRAWFGTDYILTNPIKMQIRNRTYDPNGGEGRCPKLFVNNGNSYVDFGVMAIHNPTGQDVVTDMNVKPGDVGISNYRAEFRLQEGWVGLNFSESVIDRVTLYAVGTSGNRYWCPLISAQHSRLGNVLPQLLFSDGWKAQMFLLETVDLKFIVPYQNIQRFVFEIDGCNQFKT